MWRNPPHVGQLSWTRLSASRIVVVLGPWIQELIYPKESVLTFPFHFLPVTNTALNIPIYKGESHASSLQNFYWKQQKGTEAETLQEYKCMHSPSALRGAQDGCAWKQPQPEQFKIAHTKETAI